MENHCLVATDMSASEKQHLLPLDQVGLLTGDVSVIVLHKVKFPTEIDPQVLARTKAGIRQARAVQDFGTMLAAYKDKADIQINPKALEQE